MRAPGGSIHAQLTIHIQPVIGDSANMHYIFLHGLNVQTTMEASVGVHLFGTPLQPNRLSLLKPRTSLYIIGLNGPD